MYKSYNRIVIGVDPAVTNNKNSDETGIIVAGIGARTGKYYVLDDLSGQYAPNQWAKQVIAAYHTYNADRVVAEVNQGGDMVRHTIHVTDPTISYKAVRAIRGKHIRAEPIAALYEKGDVFHTRPFKILEEHLLSYMPMAGKSSDRVDALVWALTDLSQNSREGLPRMWMA